MANAVKTPDGSLELPLREGAMYKQSGGSVNSGKRSRRRSVGEIVNKWDERYFVMTPRKLSYFKSETDFDSKKDPKGFLELSQFVFNVSDTDKGGFFARGPERVFSFKLGDEGATLRWIISLRAVNLCSMKTWKTKDVVQICELLEVKDIKAIREAGPNGQKMAKIKSEGEIKEVLGLSDDADIKKVWKHLENIRADPVLNWLSRFSSFCQSLVKKRPMSDVEMAALTDLSWGITVINEVSGSETTVDEITEQLDGESFFDKEKVDLENVDTAVCDDV